MATRENQTVSKLELQNPVIAPSPGSRTVVGGRAITNAMLLSIPDEEFKLLRPHLEFVELAFHQSLYEPRKRIEFAFFLNQGMASLVIATSDGRSVEVGIVGKEGYLGAPLAVGLHMKSVSRGCTSSGNCLKSKGRNAGAYSCFSSRAGIDAEPVCTNPGTHPLVHASYSAATPKIHACDVADFDLYHRRQDDR